MKKISLYMSLAVTSLFLGACNEDFDDWANPITNPQDELITIPGMTASNVDAVDLGKVEDESVAVFTLSQPALPEGVTLGDARLEITPEGQDDATPAKLNAEANGQVSVAELQAMVEETFGKRPVERTYNAKVMLDAIKDGQAAFVDAGKVVIKVTPKAPQISDAYYIIGGIDGTAWDVANTNLQFNHSGSDVYEDPVFTITIPVAEGENWFAITDQIAIDNFNATGGWDQVIGCAEGNGNNGMEGKVARRSVIGNDGSFKVVVDGDAKFIKITLDMMEYSYKIEKLNFAPYFYEIGNDSGWATSNPLYGANFDGKYQGYYYLNGEFKFKPNADNWNGDYEFDGEGKIADNGGANCPAPETGFYQIDVDLVAGTYALTEVKSITVVGNHNGWNQADAAQHMTFNADLRCWEITTSLTNGFKFAMNDDWATSWGGANDNPESYDLLTSSNGKDLNVPAGDGIYKVQLYLTCETKHKVVLEKQ